MSKLRGLSLAIVACAVVLVGDSSYISAQSRSEGKLIVRSSERTILDLKARTQNVGTLVLNKFQGSPPTCRPGAPGSAESVARLKKRLGIEKLSQLGILVSPARKDLGLHLFWLEIRAGNKILFRTKPECTGCSVTYKAIAASQSRRSGYVFALDREALAVGNEFFVPENSILLKASGHNGAVTTFTFIKLTDAADSSKN
ncbi:MAG TPA: hypothetical protein VKA70_05705 [Blastocatellia bacterium]|nr:hypothetical protein [Blastocatellia bacterium]